MTIGGVGNRKPLISLEKALSKIYEVKGYIIKSGKYKGIINSRIETPQILIGHKVKLVLVDKKK